MGCCRTQVITLVNAVRTVDLASGTTNATGAFTFQGHFPAGSDLVLRVKTPSAFNGSPKYVDRFTVDTGQKVRVCDRLTCLPCAATVHCKVRGITSDATAHGIVAGHNFEGWCHHSHRGPCATRRIVHSNSYPNPITNQNTGRCLSANATCPTSVLRTGMTFKQGSKCNR